MAPKEERASTRIFAIRTLNSAAERMKQGGLVRPLGSGGFTLIEILLALMIVALMFGGVTRLLRSGFDAEGRRFVQRLQGTMKYFYTKAVTTGDTYRLVFDLDKQSFSAEVAEGSYVHPTEEMIQQHKKTAEDVDESAQDEDGEDAPMKLVPPTALTFGPAVGLHGVGKSGSLPHHVRILELRFPAFENPARLIFIFIRGGMLMPLPLFLPMSRKIAFLCFR